MSNSDSPFQLAYIRFRQILIRKPSYFDPFRYTTNAFCALSSLSSSPHTQPKLLKKSINFFDCCKFFCFFFKYLLELFFSLFTYSSLIISSYRWSTRSSRYQSSIKSSLSLYSNSGFLYFRSYLDTSTSSNSLLSCLLLRPAIELYLDRIRQTNNDITSHYDSNHENSREFTHFTDFLDYSLASGNINRFLLLLSKSFFLLVVGFFNLIHLFAKKKIYFISTNCWNITDYLHHALALSNFDVILVGCQHGCKYFESMDPFTEVEINSSCFHKFIKFGLSKSDVNPDDVLKLVPQSNYYDIVYVMKYFPSGEPLPDFSSLFTILSRLSTIYSLQIRIHPKSSYLLPKLSSIFHSLPGFNNINFFIAVDKFVGLPSCNIVIYDSPYSTLAWHSTCRGIESVYVEYDSYTNEFSHLYTQNFILRPFDDDGLYEYVKSLN